MSTLTIECGEEIRESVCDCCGGRSLTVYGFVFKDGDAFGVYHAGWALAHPQLGVTMAISTGDWSDDADPADRIAMAVEVRPTDSEIHFSFVDRTQSPWRDHPRFGTWLSREQALSSPSKTDTLRISELVVCSDAHVKAALEELGSGDHR